jgi:hypothetical protein
VVDGEGMLVVGPGTVVPPGTVVVVEPPGTVVPAKTLEVVEPPGTLVPGAPVVVVTKVLVGPDDDVLVGPDVVQPSRCRREDRACAAAPRSPTLARAAWRRLQALA